MTAICTGAIVAAVCVWQFTPRPVTDASGQRQAKSDDELPPPLASSPSSSSAGQMFASDEGQGSALDSTSPLPLTEAPPSESR